MATIEQAPPAGSTTPAEANVLNSMLAKAYTLNWELIFYVVLFFIAVATRLIGLGDRVMSHDESLHVKYSFDLYQNGNFQHTPLMHGPILFHMTALSYFLFGVNDFTARLYPAILGIIMVFMPKLLFQRWLGRLGAMVASVLILISPMLLYHHRYIREDTPSIFFTLLMVFAVFAYVDGTQPRKLRWLILLSGAMLMSMGSKEVSFMYIAIFGSILTFIWIMQVIQGIRTGEVALFRKQGTKGLFRTIGEHTNSVVQLLIAGSLVGIILALGATLVLSIIPPDSAVNDTNLQYGQFLWMMLIIVPLVLVVISTALVRFTKSPLLGFIVFVVFMALTLLFLTDLSLTVRVLLGLAALGVLWLVAGMARPGDERGIPWGDIIITGSIVAAILAGGLIWCVVQIDPLIPQPEPTVTQVDPNVSQPDPNAAAVDPNAPPADPNATPAALQQQRVDRIKLVFRLGVTVGLLVLVGFVMFLVRSVRGMRLPWGSIAIVLLVAAIMATMLVTLEERSRSITKGEGEKTITQINDNWITASWVIGAIAVVFIAYLRFRTRFFDEMKRYPVFDTLMVMGSLVLPWLSALAIFLAGYDVGGGFTSDVDIWGSVRGVAPFLIVSIVAGLAWNPGRWVACAAVFYSLFVFFFTTVFTNMYGIGTGLVGSLGYWLNEQGTRRGSQPQYYYFLELGMYEYLPVIGAAFAGVVGLLGMWRFRYERVETERQAALEAEAAQSVVEYTEAGDISNTDSVTPVEPVAVYGLEAEQVIEVPVVETLPSMEGGEPTTAAVDIPHDVPQVSEYAEGFIPVETEEPIPALPPIEEAERLERIPFLPFVGWWALLIILAFTMAGEKMPWLTTHLTLPLGFLTAWYVGTQLERIDWAEFWKRSWGIIILIPILIVALSHVIPVLISAIGNLVSGQALTGLERTELLRISMWMGAVLIAGLVMYGIWYIWRRSGTHQTMRVGILGAFVLLAIITARHAWMAAYIYFDSAREFLVYAHGAPANKNIIEEIQEISRRTTDGKAIKIAYDNHMSWPGSWYFQQFPNARYLGDNPNTASDLDTFLAIAVGEGNNAKIEPLLAEKFYQARMIRMWWPMQDYFDLRKPRIDNVFAGDTNLPEGWVSGSQLRQGLWDIWWNHDYKKYGEATGKNFDESNWPVADWMYFYVRKDVAAQIWTFGTGSVKVQGLPEDPFNKLRCDTCQPSMTFASRGSDAGQLNFPRDLVVAPNGNLYVADSQNNRIVVFNADGQRQLEYGVAGSIDQNTVDNVTTGGQFREPWGIAVGQDGTIYVADTWNHRVQIFNKDFTFIRAWGSFEQVQAGTSGTKPDGMWGPRDIAVDANNNVYVADTGNKRIRVYDQNGTLLRDIGNDALNEPVGLAINNATAELFVADTWNKRIQVFSLDGALVRSWSVQAWGPTTESGNRPFITLDQNGTTLFLTDPDAGRILVYTAQGQPLLSFFRTDAQLSGIAVDAIGNIFIAESNNSVISRFARESLPELNAPQPPVQPEQVQPATEDVVTEEF